MRKLKMALMGVAALATLSAGSVKAQVVQALTVGGGFQTFDFGLAAPDPSDVFQDGGGNQLDFTFTLTHPDYLTVVDGYFDGDQFQVFSNGGSLGLTSTPLFDGQYVDDNWFAALNNPAFSRGVWLLGPGTYDITGIAVQSPFGNGEAAIGVGGVPEPATWAMLILGLGMIGFAARQRRGQGLAVAA